MTLNDWKAQMQYRYAGRFNEEAGGLIRHDEQLDCRGFECCPILVLAIDTRSGHSRYYGNVDAGDVGEDVLRLPSVAVDDIIRAADDHKDGPGKDGPVKLREWMLRVLVHGQTPTHSHVAS